MLFQSVSGGNVSGDSIVFSNINYQNEFQNKAFSITLKATAAGCIIDSSSINDNRDNNMLGGFLNSNLRGNNPWSTSSQFAFSPINSWQVFDAYSITHSELKSLSFQVKPISVLSFQHRFDFEGGYDGGTVEVSKNNGLSWDSISTDALQNGFNSSINNQDLVNKKGYSGTQLSFIKSIFNLTKYAGNNLSLRFRAATDSLNDGMNINYDGWNVDDIVVANGCGSNVKFYVYDSANNLLDSSIIPVFITPKPLPVIFVDFKANLKNKISELSWNVNEEINISKYKIERSIDNKTWNFINEVNANKSRSEEHTSELQSH